MSVIDFPQAGTIGSTLKPKRWDIEIYQGDTFAFALQFKDASNALINVTGWTALAQIKNSDGTPATTPAFATTVGGADGKITIKLTDVQSNDLAAGEYMYDVQVTDSAGNKRTYIGGRITVTEDISE